MIKSTGGTKQVGGLTPLGHMDDAILIVAINFIFIFNLA